MRSRMALAALASLTFCTCGSAFAEVIFGVSTGLEYSSGDYGGADTTEVVAVPLSARASIDTWTLRVSAPFLVVNGGANVAEADDGAGAGANSDRSVQGFGDTTIALEKNFPHVLGENGYVEVEGRVRLPTGDEEKGLGVGATDYGVETEIGSVSENGGVYVAVGYRFLGQNDSGNERQDGYTARVGAWLPVGRRVRAGLSASWREAAVEGNDDPASATGFVSLPVSRRVRLTINAGAGLSDASADYSAGFRLTWRP